MQTHVIDQIYVIGIELRTVNQPGRADVEIPQHWDRFIRENVLEGIPHKKNEKVFVLYTDYEGDFTQPYSMIIGCEVASLTEIPDGLVGKTIPAGTYALFPAEGAFPESVMQAWQDIWNSSVNRAYTVDFETYPADFQEVEEPRVDIFIGLKR